MTALPARPGTAGAILRRGAAGAPTRQGTFRAPTRRGALSLAAMAALCPRRQASAAAPGAAEGWPLRALRFIVPFTPGGPTDAVCRLLGLRLAEVLGTGVVIENLGGAGGTLGMERLTRAPADGSAIGLGTTGTHAINRYLYARLPYDPVGGFTPLSVVSEYVNMLVVRADHPARDLPELIGAARRGGASYASAGNGSTNHLSGELLRIRTGAAFQHVPFRGSGPAMAEVVAGRVDCMFDTLAALPQVEAGRVRVLAVTGPARHRLLPGVPTVAETLPGYEVVGWFGAFAPPGLPAAIAAPLGEGLRTALASPDFAARLRGMGFEPASGTPEDLAGRVARDDALWGPVIRSAGLRPE